MLNVVILSVVMLSVVLAIVVLVIVLAPIFDFHSESVFFSKKCSLGKI
jgi:hypothetical protein